MASITSRTHFENYAKQIPWQDIFEPEGFESEKLDKLRGSEEHAIGWLYDDGELRIYLQTFGEDEPANQGPWSHIALRTSEAHGGHGFGDRILRRISRRATASPATGSHHLHEDEQKALLLEAFTR